MGTAHHVTIKILFGAIPYELYVTFPPILGFKSCHGAIIAFSGNEPGFGIGVLIENGEY